MRRKNYTCVQYMFACWPQGPLKLSDHIVAKSFFSLCKSVLVTYPLILKTSEEKFTVSVHQVDNAMNLNFMQPHSTPFFIVSGESQMLEIRISHLASVH